jgi:sterol desaturase/sphingolipid hydroxylase (fatty acid hydroxylase superfamily)
LATAIITIALFIAYEFGYWLDHYLSHRVQFLWEFHKVHHTSEVLSPLTNFRVHPIDGIVFYNVLAVVMGSTEGAMNYALGQQTPQFVISSSNAIVVIFTYLLAHLHHTNFWIAFTGTWGRLLISPAHHQIHHSTNPVHFNKNMGSCLAIWDWMFGTLHVPSPRREKLTFGVEPKLGNPHSVTGALIAPVGHALALLDPRPKVQPADNGLASG